MTTEAPHPAAAAELSVSYTTVWPDAIVQVSPLAEGAEPPTHVDPAEKLPLCVEVNAAPKAPIAWAKKRQRESIFIVCYHCKNQFVPTYRPAIHTMSPETLLVKPLPVK